MKILAINCATRSTSIAITDGSYLLADFTLFNFKTENLIVKIKELLEEVSLDKKDLDLLATVSGPGGYTSLRSSVSTVNSLALALNLPIAAFDTLKALAWQNRAFEGVVVSVLKARADEYNFSMYGSNENKLNPLIENLSITLDNLVEKLKDIQNPFLICGDGAEDLTACLKKFNKTTKAKLAPLNSRYPLALPLAEMAINTKKENLQTSIKPIYSHQPNISLKTKKRII
jgi:tRNA threonylcarbamoyladenosine biosynthesis protein TsaB